MKKAKPNSDKYISAIHAKPTDAMAVMITQTPLNDSITLINEYTVDGVRLVLPEKSELKVSTHKLLTALLIDFSTKNHIEHNSVIQDNTAIISIKAFARLLHPNDQINKTLLDSVRKTIKKDVKILESARLSWSEREKNREISFQNIKIIDEYKCHSGVISISINSDFAKYLLSQRITYYPRVLFEINGKSANAYSLCLKLTEYFFMNQDGKKPNSFQRIRIKNLLSVTSIPSIDHVRKTNQSWNANINERLDKYFNYLINIGLISSFKVVKPKGKLINEEELVDLCLKFETYQDLLIQYSLCLL